MYHQHLLRILSWSREPRKWVCCELFDANLFCFMRNNRPWKVRSYLFTHLLAPIASAVGFLHEKNYVHKDINSHHILFLNNLSRVVLSGFKFSKSLNETGYFLSSHQRGEPQWMDPDCYDHPYSFESDVYSLGVILVGLCELKAVSTQELKAVSTQHLKAPPSSFNPAPESAAVRFQPNP